ncbi:metallophosphoesterase family protein [Salipiger mucosus]|uniref:metallophosphoesterase family protein n=1 Tax=Salipiger mucosus TaxID=263378 RepID=UPI000373D6CA|nr:metallophosphoesterase family protein [Salipiger mucosus]
MSPELPFYAVGDIHGCEGLVRQLLTRLEAGSDADAAKLVFVGDYIDRGDESAQVLTLLSGIQEEMGRESVICLRGNHEQMLIDCLDDPVGTGARWIRNGGLQTLASYGVAPPQRAEGDDAWLAMRDSLREAIGERVETWLRGLPVIWRTGNVVVVHAGADPAVPIDDQWEDILVWGHPDFRKRPRTDGLWIVHGHTIVDAAHSENGRIAVDTGAYATGRLTAAHVREGAVDFFSTG